MEGHGKLKPGLAKGLKGKAEDLNLIIDAA
jgi:hypothetical protein